MLRNCMNFMQAESLEKKTLNKKSLLGQNCHDPGKASKYIICTAVAQLKLTFALYHFYYAFSRHYSRLHNALVHAIIPRKFSCKNFFL